MIDKPSDEQWIEITAALFVRLLIADTTRSIAKGQLIEKDARISLWALSFSTVKLDEALWASQLEESKGQERNSHFLWTFLSV